MATPRSFEKQDTDGLELDFEIIQIVWKPFWASIMRRTKVTVSILELYFGEAPELLVRKHYFNKPFKNDLCELLLALCEWKKSS